MLKFGVMLQHDDPPTHFTPSRYGRNQKRLKCLSITKHWSNLKIHHQRRRKFPCGWKWEGQWTISVRANGSLHTAFMHYGQSEAQWTLLLLRVAARSMAPCTLSAAEAGRNWKLRLQIAFLRVPQFETAEERHGMVEHRWPWTAPLNEWTCMILPMLLLGLITTKGWQKTVTNTCKHN